MNFLKRLFGYSDPIIKPPTVRASPPPATPASPAPGAKPPALSASGARDEDMTLIDPVAKDRWQAEHKDANPDPAPKSEGPG